MKAKSGVWESSDRGGIGGVSVFAREMASPGIFVVGDRGLGRHGRVSLSAGRNGVSLVQVDRAFAFLADCNLDGTDEPLQIYLHCLELPGAE